jgi:NADH-ubiquinone oxidoreductase chain 1
MKNILFDLYLYIIEPLYQVLSVLIPMLLAVAFMTIIERKQLAAHQRRVGPTEVGYYGVLQPLRKSGITN